MSEKNDGGPAFPECGERGKASGFEGMNLRDYFAGQALAGMCANKEDVGNSHAMFAALAYSYSDAMITEREKL